MDYLKKSRIEEVLIAILGKGTVTSQLISRIEKILDAIRVNGSYDGIAMSEVEEILICILRGERFEKPTHSRIAAMLKVKANGGEYTELRKSRVEELIFEWINAVESATYTGTLPTTLRTVEGYLESYKIYGNTVQDGTPTPENPIVPSGCGERTENLWNYKIEQGTTGGGATQPADNRVRSILFPITENTYTFVFDNYENYNFAYDAWYGSNLLEASAWLDNNTFTLPESTKTLRIKIRRKDNANFTPSDISEVMLTPGSTASETYIPHGYKLPLAVNGVEYPIYILVMSNLQKMNMWIAVRAKYTDELRTCPHQKMSG